MVVLDDAIRRIFGLIDEKIDERLAAHVTEVHVDEATVRAIAAEEVRRHVEAMTREPATRASPLPGAR